MNKPYGTCSPYGGLYSLYVASGQVIQCKTASQDRMYCTRSIIRFSLNSLWRSYNDIQQRVNNDLENFFHVSRTYRIFSSRKVRIHQTFFFTDDVTLHSSGWPRTIFKLYSNRKVLWLINWDWYLGLVQTESRINLVLKTHQSVEKLEGCIEVYRIEGVISQNLVDSTRKKMKGYRVTRAWREAI